MQGYIARVASSVVAEVCGKLLNEVELVWSQLVTFLLSKVRLEYIISFDNHALTRTGTLSDKSTHISHRERCCLQYCTFTGILLVFYRKLDLNSVVHVLGKWYYRW